jgi:hypothetical protein
VDGVHWVRRNAGNPVLVPTNGKFDWRNVNCPSSLWDGMIEKVWYTGQNATTTQLGFATGTIGAIKGTYTSPPFDFGGDVDFKNINWTFDTPSGTTATMAVRTETKGKGEGVEELAVREELRLMLMGPEPVASSAPAKPKPKPKGPVAPKRTAPRVMDDLF